MLSELQKLIFLQIKSQNEFLGIQNEFPANNTLFCEYYVISFIVQVVLCEVKDGTKSGFRHVFVQGSNNCIPKSHTHTFWLP